MESLLVGGYYSLLLLDRHNFERLYVLICFFAADFWFWFSRVGCVHFFKVKFVILLIFCSIIIKKHIDLWFLLMLDYVNELLILCLSP